MDEDWHTWTLEWTTDGIRYFVDGKELDKSPSRSVTLRWPVSANWPIQNDGELDFLNIYSTDRKR